MQRNIDNDDNINCCDIFSSLAHHILYNNLLNIRCRFYRNFIFIIIGCDVYYVSLVSFVSLSSKQTKDSIRMMGV